MRRDLDNILKRLLLAMQELDDDVASSLCHKLADAMKEQEDVPEVHSYKDLPDTWLVGEPRMGAG